MTSHPPETLSLTGGLCVGKSERVAVVPETSKGGPD